MKSVPHYLHNFATEAPLLGGKPLAGFIVSKKAASLDTVVVR